MAKFITLAGRKQVGKDTSANLIKKMLESNGYVDKVHIVHFADALKDACSVVFGIPREDMESEDGKQKLTDISWPVKLLAEIPPDMPGMSGYNVEAWTTKDVYLNKRPHSTLDDRKMTVREVLQFVGTNLFRNQLDPDVWVKSVYRKQYKEDDVVIVADCRFPNEAEFAKKNGYLIHITRDLFTTIDVHPSEIALDNYKDYDISIDNTRSIERLNLKLQGFLISKKFIG